MTALSLPPAEELTATQHAALLRQHVTSVIRWAERNDPRSLQTAIGPSEVGHPCARRLAYRVLGVPERNDTDRWRTTVGRAVHNWLADQFTAANEAAGGGRYLVEERVKPGNGPEGSSDLFIRGFAPWAGWEPKTVDPEHLVAVLDRISGTVTDWKIVGATSLSRYRSKGPSEVYRVQFHLYGYGMECAGEDVRWVSMVCLPQSGTLDDAVIWSERYDRQVALDALKRLEDITEAVATLDVESYPARMAAIPADVGPLCRYCPWFVPRSTDFAQGCPGNYPPPATPAERSNAA